LSATDLLAIPLGLIAGFAATLFGGAGLGALAQPGLRAIGVSPIETIATALSVIFPAALLSTVRYRGSRLIDRSVVLVVTAAGVPFAVAGALLTDRPPGSGHAQQLFIALLLLAGSSQMLRRSRSGAPAHEGAGDPLTPRGRRRRLVGTGSAAGIFAGGLGLSGGMIIVPALSELVGLPAHQAVATSTLIVALLALPGVAAHATIGNIEWGVAGLLAVGVVPGVVLGTSITLRADDRTMRRLFGCALLLLGLVYATGEFVALA
jgi:uncharacterized membrane protein YfcA